MHLNSPPLSATRLTDVTTSSSCTGPSEASESLPVLPRRKPRSQPLPFDIPDSLEPILTTTTLASEVYSNVQDSRDRRFRLLLRRFANQIQYGCRNPHCDVPTCLSYRKQHAGAPVRPYTDVAARALAWKCVEQYATGNREWKTAVGLEDEAFAAKGRRNKGKTKTRYSGDGLCRNDPVVPWYEDPNDYRSRKRTTTSKDPSMRTANSERIRSPVPGSVGTEECLLPELRSKQLSVSTVEQEKTAIVQDGTSLQKFESERQPNEVSSDPTKSGVVEGSQNTELDQNRLLHDDSTLDISLRQAKKTDKASFTQFLYNLPLVKNFDSLKSRDILEHSHTSLVAPQHQVSNHSNDQASVAGDNIPDQPQQEHTEAPSNLKHKGLATEGSISHAYTFSLLPASAVTWLRSALLLQPSRNADLSRKRECPPTQIDEFASRSLHFVLSHPVRLILSAQSWGEFDKRPSPDVSRSRLREDCEMSSVHVVDDMVKAESRLEKSNASITVLPQWDDVESVCNSLMEIAPAPPGPTISNHLFAALQHSYAIPTGLKRLQQPEKRNECSSPITLSDREVAHLFMLVIGCIAAISGEVRDQNLEIPVDALGMIRMTPASFYLTRSSGQVFPFALILQSFPSLPDTIKQKLLRGYVGALNRYDDPHVSRLFECMADIISHRKAVSMAANTGRSYRESKKPTPSIVETIINLWTETTSGKTDHKPQDPQTVYCMFDYMQTILLTKWDRRPIVSKVGPVSGALHMLAGMYKARKQLDFPWECFQMHFIADALDEIDMPFEWLSFREDGKRMHILSFAFLFRPATLVRYFRAINVKIMQQMHENALVMYANARQQLDHTPIPIYGAKEILAKTRPHMARYLVLTIRRQNVLEDAINQIWRRERQELMRPLKVRIGKDEGEDGLDHGGVQQEFFRLAFAEALDVRFGMFTIDETTRMTWFQPESFEPAYRFEALGILMSLAVYNAVTLPVTFPVAFYRKLLNLKVKKLDHISDGWPDLAKGLQALLDWKDGDVGDVIARTYEYSYDVFGKTVTIDMERVSRDEIWPRPRHRMASDRVKTASFEFPPSPLGTPSDVGSPYTGTLQPFESNKVPPLDIKGTSTPPSLESDSGETEASLVTNDNREKYVKDYVFWLTDKSIRQQYEAFARGFYTCLDQTALSMFTPEALKKVVEGHPEIDIDGLERTASYDDYETNEQIIKDFWSVVRDFSPDQHRQLLEFVTASDRVPVNGIESVTFIIQRNGEGDERLPSSSTCYGRLLLPHYSNKDVLRTKLEKAIENSVGFGSL